MDPVVERFSEEIRFYIIYLDFTKKFKQLGLSFCYPEITTNKEEVYLYEGFDLALAHDKVTKGETVVVNDFWLENGERLVVVTGPNQGGKTTFARMFGQVHYLAKLGVPIPGKKAKIFLCDKIFTHFEREEKVQNLRGKLEAGLSKLTFLKPQSYTFSLHPRDDAGIETLANIRGRSINQVAKILANAGDHILEFFSQLRAELAFYMGAMNLYEELSNLNVPVCFPEPYHLDRRIRKFIGLYDVSLALITGKNVVGNELNTIGKDLFIITGANRGGKTTFLRSIGQAQILMQSGIFVPAIYFSANINKKIFTHFYRKEDPQLESGKLDEELKRFDRIVSKIRPNSLLLLNESFSSTNEKEGSEIAKQIVEALIENNIEVFYVTHLYEFAKYFYDQNLDNVHFLRAERKEDGRRTFKILEGKPLPTGYAKDLYEGIFGNQETFVEKYDLSSRV